MKKLTKAQRQQLFDKYGGHCAYCGELLKDGWHADHFNPVRRVSKYVRGKGFKATGELERPENDVLENYMPSCPPCNIDKHAMPLEAWRKKLENGVNVLRAHSPTFRHCLRFKLLKASGAKVVFYFEKGALS